MKGLADGDDVAVVGVEDRRQGREGEGIKQRDGGGCRRSGGRKWEGRHVRHIAE